MSKKKIELTSVECDHLLTLLYNDKESGDYYGNQNYYYNRTDKLISMLGGIYDPK